MTMPDALTPASSASSAPSTSSAPADVLDFWLADGLDNWPEGAVPAGDGPVPTPGWPSQDMGARWFTGGPALDAEIREKFGATVAQALAGGLRDWEARPLERLALVILLDQFPRNIHRGQPQAFAGDARAQRLVMDALDRGLDQSLPWVGRVFLYMPLMHAEDLALQEECVRRFRQLAADVPEALRAGVANSLRFAEEHRDIIARLGRFPYRNAALGRDSQPAELEFLKNGPRFGQ
jgi:uncharacterized protein (DUF924 family)